MNSDTMESSSLTSSNGLNGTSANANVVKRVAQKAHEAVDKLEQYRVRYEPGNTAITVYERMDP